MGSATALGATGSWGSSGKSSSPTADGACAAAGAVATAAAGDGTEAGTSGTVAAAADGVTSGTAKPLIDAGPLEAESLTGAETGGGEAGAAASVWPVSATTLLTIASSGPAAARWAAAPACRARSAEDSLGESVTMTTGTSLVLGSDLSCCVSA